LPQWRFLLPDFAVTHPERLTYDYAVDREADTAGAHVLSLVGASRRVLEIGAGPGAVTRELIANGCQMVAVELDPAAIEKLRQFCPSVYQADLNQPDWASVLAAEAPFETIVAADVFEHLNQPWGVLAGLKPLLADGGHLVVSLPHVGHHGVVACLLDEDFEYREWGLLDRTHIRFFGIKNMQALFDGAGLHIVDAEVVVRRPERCEFAGHWTRLPPATQHAIEQANPLGCAYQIVIKAAAVPPAGGATDLDVLVRDRIGVRQRQGVPLRVAAKDWARGVLQAALPAPLIQKLKARSGRATNS
jgi:2-polyprenyl-3-methyl-5-hydroxy-6-metoxy-1,4-benzoquinol methylase